MTTTSTVDRRRSLLIRQRPLGATERVTVTGRGKLSCGTVVGRLRESGWYAPLDLAATDGLQHAAGVLAESVDVTSRPCPADVVVHAAALNGALLVWPETLTAGQQARALGQLRVFGITAA